VIVVCIGKSAAIMPDVQMYLIYRKYKIKPESWLSCGMFYRRRSGNQTDSFIGSVVIEATNVLDRYWLSG
jgi:hypothetical protein